MLPETTALWLASASPRRRELLAQLGIDCQVWSADIEEQCQPEEPPERCVARLARDKALYVSRQIVDQGLAPLPVLAADTMVVLDGEALGKPSDRVHAKAMLTALSGRTHEVMTAIAVVHQDQVYEALNRSRVEFRPLTGPEIDAYWATGEPADKAGAYAVQGLAAQFIRSLHGSYSGVMGLPLFELAQILEAIGEAG